MIKSKLVKKLMSSLISVIMVVGMLTTMTAGATALGPEERATLGDVIATAEAQIQANFTGNSWQNLQAVLEDARDVYADTEATTAQIETAIDELNGAITALVSIVALRTVRNQARSIDPAEFVGGWQDFLDRLGDVEDLLEDPAATSTEISSAISALRGAIGALVRDPNARRIVNPNWLAYEFRSILMDPVNGQLGPEFTYTENPHHGPFNYAIDRYLPSWVGYHNRAPVFWTVEGYAGSAWRFVQEIHNVVEWMGTHPDIGGRHNLELNDGEGGIVDFIAMDGWVDSTRGGMTPNEHGYPLHHYRGWETVRSIVIDGETIATPNGVTNEMFAEFVASHGMIAGTYYNPLWLNRMFVYWPCKPHAYEATGTFPFLNTDTGGGRVLGAPSPDGLGFGSSRFNMDYNNPNFAHLTVWNTQRYANDENGNPIIGQLTQFAYENPELSDQYPDGLPLRYIVRQPSFGNWTLTGDGLLGGIGAGGPQNSCRGVRAANPGTPNPGLLAPVGGGVYTFQNWFIVNPFAPGAREYVKGMIHHYREIGMGFIKTDFMRNNDESWGPMSNVLALRWMREEAGTDFLISTANSRMRNFYECGLTYADMIRISEDQNSHPGWDRFSTQNRGRVHLDQWRTTHNQVDAANFWSFANRPDGAILDGHQTKVFDYDVGAPPGVHTELKHVLGHKTLTGSGIQLSGSLVQLQQIPLDIMFNPAMMSLIEERFIARPVELFTELIREGAHGANPAWLNPWYVTPNWRQDTTQRNTFQTGLRFDIPLALTQRQGTQIFYGTTQDGDTVIGFFNRENTPQRRNLSFADIGLEGKFDARDLWTATAENPEGDLVATGIEEWDEVLIGRGSRVIRLTPTAGVYLSANELALTLNGAEGADRAILTAEVFLPDGEVPTGVTWTSSHPEVATVDANGLVVAVSAGTTTIRATSNDEATFYDEAIVTVVDMNILPTSITLNEIEVTLERGQTFELEVTAILPATAGNRDVTWSSSNDNVATVDSDGVVTAVSAGTAIITATSVAAPAVTATSEITVLPDATDAGTAIVVSIQNDYNYRQIGAIRRNNQPRQIISMLPAGTQFGTRTADGLIQLRAIVEGVYDTSVTWSSMDESIATVSATGLVTVVGEGTTSITATSNADGLSFSRVFVHGARHDWDLEAHIGITGIAANAATVIDTHENREFDIPGDGPFTRIVRDVGTNINRRNDTGDVSDRAMVGNINAIRGIDITFNAPEAGFYNIGVYYVMGTDAGHSPYPDSAHPDRENIRFFSVSNITDGPGDAPPRLAGQGTRGTFNQHSEFEPVSITIPMEAGLNTFRIRGVNHPGDGAAVANAPNIDMISVTKATQGRLGVIGNVANVDGNILTLDVTAIADNKLAITEIGQANIDIYRDGIFVSTNGEIEVPNSVYFSQQSIGGRTSRNGFVYAGFFPNVAAARIDRSNFDLPGTYTAVIRFGDMESEPIFLFNIEGEITLEHLPSTVTINVGETRTFALPPAFLEAATWSSIHPTIATVSDAGEITALVAGQTVINASKDGETAHIQVIIREDDYASINVPFARSRSDLPAPDAAGGHLNPSLRTGGMNRGMLSTGNMGTAPYRLWYGQNQLAANIQVGYWVSVDVEVPTSGKYKVEYIFQSDARPNAPASTLRAVLQHAIGRTGEEENLGEPHNPSGVTGGLVDEVNVTDVGYLYYGLSIPYRFFSKVLTPEEGVYLEAGMNTFSSTITQRFTTQWQWVAVEVRLTPIIEEVVPTEITVTFNPTGGIVSPTSRVVIAGETFGGAFPMPTRAGYVFQGWFTAIEGGDRIRGTDTVTQTTDITLYASWRPAGSIAVTFNPTGGTVTETSRFVIPGETFGGAFRMPTRPGYVFEGWFTERTGGARVRGTDIVTQTFNFTLFAQWRREGSIIVTFNPNGGTVTETSRAVMPGETFGGAFRMPTRPGYVFMGWFTARVGGNRVLGTGTVTQDSNFTLFAQWRPEGSIAVTFNPNGGTVTEASRFVMPGETFGGAFHMPARPGYIFMGWFTARVGGDRIRGTDTVTQTSNFTVFAQWRREGSIIVTFNPTGGTVAETSRGVMTGETFGGAFHMPIRPGYIFEGWFTAVVGGDRIRGTDTVRHVANFTLFARWRPE